MGRQSTPQPSGKWHLNLTKSLLLYVLLEPTPMTRIDNLYLPQDRDRACWIQVICTPISPSKEELSIGLCLLLKQIPILFQIIVSQSYTNDLLKQNILLIVH